MSDSETDAARLSSNVSIKPPPFMEENSMAWFAILEAQFKIARISEPTTKFYHILASLPSEIVSKIPHTILQAANYDSLKNSVISTYEQSKPEMLDKLMTATSITGKPSAYLNELASLATRIGVSDDIVRHKFLQALPSSISPVVASQSMLEIAALGKLADDLVLYFNRNEPTVNQLSRAPSPHVNYRNRSPSRNNANTASGIKPFHDNQRPKICRFHIYYGQRAKYCRRWCQWPNKSSAQVHPNSRPASPNRADNQSGN